MKLPNKGRGITLATLVLALGAAVYMNWAFAKQTPPTAQADQGQEAVETSASDGAVPVLEPFSAKTAAPNQARITGRHSWSAPTRIPGPSSSSRPGWNGRNSRDEALDSIKKALKNTGLSAEEKEKLTEELEVRVERHCRSGAEAQDQSQRVCRLCGHPGRGAGGHHGHDRK